LTPRDIDTGFTGAEWHVWFLSGVFDVAFCVSAWNHLPGNSGCGRGFFDWVNCRKPHPWVWHHRFTAPAWRDCRAGCLRVSRSVLAQL